jgi:enoyl-CoA hydratase
MIRTSVDDAGVVQITLADAEHRNAMRIETARVLSQAVHESVANGARALILAADPPVFCAGGSLDDLIEPRASLEETYAGFLALADCPVPTIAAVGGACIGAGVNLPLACDVVITTPEARFDPRWLDVGIHPGGGHLWLLRERIGRQGAAATVLLGETLDGTDAARLGLAWKCVPIDELLSTANALARRAAERDPELVQRTKRRSTQHSSTSAPRRDRGRARRPALVNGTARISRASRGAARQARRPPPG